MSAAWTILIFLAGDNDLSAAAEEDLEEMRRIGSSAEVQVVTEFDGAGPGGTRRTLIRSGGAGESALDLGETDSGDPGTLFDFVAWGVESYPAERYALVLWNHGGGWAPAEIERLAPAASERAAAALSRVFFRPTLDRLRRDGALEERAIANDDGSGHSLDTVELGAVMRRIAALVGQPLDLLGMDACLMASLEVAWELAPSARYLIASQDPEPERGWPYDRVLAAFAGAPRAPTAEIATSLVAGWDEGSSLPGVGASQVVIDLARLDQVRARLDELAIALLARFPAVAHDLWSAQRAAERLAGDTLCDLADLARSLAVATQDPAITTAARRLAAALDPGQEGALLAAAPRGGLSVYLPPPIRALSPHYRDVALARDSRWPEVLAAYHAA